MKIQNAEMEFVSFEAQDVITTSGPAADADLLKSLQEILAFLQ